MRHQRVLLLSKRLIWFLFAIHFAIGTCYPVGKPDLIKEPDLKDEKRYNNGTIVGKYTYMDNEGNPVQIKYFADDASYGVEMKSVKVLDGSSEEPTIPYVKPSPLHTGISATSGSAPSKKQRTSDQLEYFNKAIDDNHYKSDNIGSDFDIYYHNELRAPKKCGKEKVRVYKERKARDAKKGFEADKYCEQF